MTRSFPIFYVPLVRDRIARGYAKSWCETKTYRYNDIKIYCLHSVCNGTNVLILVLKLILGANYSRRLIN